MGCEIVCDARAFRSLGRWGWDCLRARPESQPPVAASNPDYSHEAVWSPAFRLQVNENQHAKAWTPNGLCENAVFRLYVQSCHL